MEFFFSKTAAAIYVGDKFLKCFNSTELVNRVYFSLYSFNSDKM